MGKVSVAFNFGKLRETLNGTIGNPSGRSARMVGLLLFEGPYAIRG
jgi:hypothetical protein